MRDPELVDDDLTDLLRAQIEAVDRRVTGGGNAFAEESDQVRVAARRVQELRAELGLGDLIESVTPPTGKPQFLLRFDTASHAGAVLKVYGMVHPAEAASQRLWAEHGVPTVAVYANGDTPTSWILMEYVAGETPPDGEFEDEAGLLACTREMAGIMSRAHDCGDPTLPGCAPVVGDTMRRLHVVTGSLAKHGYPVPEGWEAVCRRHLEAGRTTLLHGDLAAVNVMRRNDTGRLCLLDASGLTGPPEFDAARWCARMALVEGERALAEWLSIETSLDPELARALLGVETLMTGGVNELVKDEFGLPSEDRDELTYGMLDLARRLLDI